MQTPTDAPRPFMDFAAQLRPQSVLRAAVTSAYRRPEPEAVALLLEQARLAPAQAAAAEQLAGQLATTLRERKSAGGREGLVQGLVQEFSLSSQEGVALMCLAEALLRIPDAATRDALIRDKIGDGNWAAHLGRSGSLFVNAATWGLVVTGKLVTTHNETGLASALARVVARSGEPLIRKGVDMAMRLMGEQFVTGQTIDEALANARRREAEGFRYSYDMLGEAALTDADAQRYLAAYEAAIHAIGRASAGRGIYEGPGISIKLSALHPRYSRAQVERTMAELYPRLRTLALLARHYDIGLNIDAEEADRLELSLDLLELLCAEPGLEGWHGIGFVVQAYQKRCPHVVDFIVDLARRTRRRIMVRLVKGAYWDSEIKRAQVDGLEGYPVYTRKVHTDVSYLACARRLLAAPDAVFPQFATHNAHTLAAIHTMAGQNYHAGQYEFQCLHGMGEPLYGQVVGTRAEGGLARPCRIYAPVGTHETLLAYLVRRLLENGANTSFVHRIADAGVPIAELVADPVAAVDRQAAADGEAGLPHPAIPLPQALFGPAGTARRNSSGIDLSNEHRLASLAGALLRPGQAWSAAPVLAGADPSAGTPQPVTNPADRRDVVGHVVDATPADAAQAAAAAVAAQPAWAATPPAERAARLERAADTLEAQMQPLLGLIVREAGKTLANAVGEVREAVDFLRYYAAQARAELTEAHAPLGPIVCISPWNFPLAIFTGQVAAALAAGNTVLAKPAEQTPLIAAQAVRLLHEAGVPAGALQLLPGPGETVGAALVADERIRGVMFTGSTDVARLLQRSLAGRLDERGQPLLLIAETGGQNAMIVDSSALAEQVVADVIASAFDSAGQRCSALRVLCLQEDSADPVLAMLRGALQALSLGVPDRLSTDVGPVIDEAAREGIEAHIAAMAAQGRRVLRLAADAQAIAYGSFVAPAVIEIESLAELQREVFGPVLHVLRYRRERLDALIAQINATGYGLTLGLHTRIDETIAQVTEQVHAGNHYVNRNIVGAVVGVQPFGGEGLSGTGPKAGGPLYLRRLVAGGAWPPSPADPVPPAAVVAAPGARAQALAPLLALRDAAQGSPALRACCARLADDTPAAAQQVLPGPTGERNLYRWLPRTAVLCLAGDADDLRCQLAHVLAVGSTAVWPAEGAGRAVFDTLPALARARVRLLEGTAPSALREAAFDAVLLHGTAQAVQEASRALAERAGPIVGLQAAAPGRHEAGAFLLERLLVERSVSINTAAAGGNASLMALS
ncbi:trifunctional transcriptional regulator/proline dehydrogenase/L-glutamate gamma-semialdehyde dehydrogenase [Aquincola sp. MAHUQ-54]|uniref:Bifunctional protein PutA n=1 Tax=Aquincola agrisoli TaxID=3119538 RepID=A0AAW9Q7R1_9BURK